MININFRVFFPILKGKDYYVMVFNIKSASIIILDNAIEPPRPQEMMLKSYGYATKVLVCNY